MRSARLESDFEPGTVRVMGVDRVFLTISRAGEMTSIMTSSLTMEARLSLTPPILWSSEMAFFPPCSKMLSFQ